MTSLTLLGALEVFWFYVNLIILVYNNNNNNNNNIVLVRHLLANWINWMKWMNITRHKQRQKQFLDSLYQLMTYQFSCSVTVSEALVLRPLLEDRGRITESIRILMTVDWMKQNCFQITTERVRRSQQFQLRWQPENSLHGFTRSCRRM